MDNKQNIRDICTSATSRKYRVYLDKKLGQGQFGSVFKATYSPGQNLENMEFAVKRIEKQKLLEMGVTQEDKVKLIERLRQEVGTWCQGSHPNIVKFIEFIETQNTCYLVSEYCEGCTLEKMILDKGKIDPQAAIPWFKDLISAISYLHSIHIIHRDIKPANLLFKGNVVKIVDFGFAKQSKEGQVQTIGIGSPKYMAPELLEQRDDYDPKVDIWALGWTFFEVIYGTDPWSTNNVQCAQDLLEQINSSDLRFPKNAKVSNELKELLSGMLQIEPSDRFSYTEMQEAASKL